ncbi:MAG TPA: single-stranded DNA-binding protein [Streptosporangiaceae bacterium]|jgi:single-strand DNA-binding protein
MINEAYFSVAGYVATEPKFLFTRGGVPTLTMRVGWTPRKQDRTTGDWADEPSSFAGVTCFRKVAENAASCLRKGDPIVVKGTLRIREFEDSAGVKRSSADVIADTIGHDLSRGTSAFTKSRAQLPRTAMERYRDELGEPRPQPEDESARADSDGDPGANWQSATQGPSGQLVGQADPDLASADRAAADQAPADQAAADERGLSLDDDEGLDEDEVIEALTEAEPVALPA